MTRFDRRALVLLAASTWFTLDLVRASGPLISQLFDLGPRVVAPATFGAFVGGAALAAIAHLIGRHLGPGISTVGVAFGAVCLRIIFPLSHGDARVGIGLAALGLSLSLLVLAVRITAVDGGGAATLAASGTGAGLAVIEQGILRTWDAVWRHDLLGWTFGILVCVLVLQGALRARERPSEGPTMGLWAFGLWLSLLAFAFANIAFLSSQATLHLSASIALCGVGLGVGVIWSLHRPTERPAMVALVGAVAILATSSALFLGGPLAATMIPVAAASTTYLTSRAIRPEPQRRDGMVRLLFSASAMGLGLLLPFMLVQLDYEIPLGFPHLLVMVAATTGIAVAGLWGSWEHRPSPVRIGTSPGMGRGAWVPAVVTVALTSLVAVPTAIGFNTGAPLTPEPPVDLTVVTWNLHYGVTPRIQGGPDVDLFSLTQTLRDQDADVLLLQEVERGWILGSGTDLLQVLADSLEMDYVYIGTHDRQFGNAILSRFDIVDPTVIPLPYGAGPQRRAAILATIETEAGPVRVASLHLQNHHDGATRVKEIDAFLDALPDDGIPTVVGGDFNDIPNSLSVSRMREAGFESVHDQLGNGGDTYSGADFRGRLDYLWVRSLDSSDFVLGTSLLSDHVSLAVTVSTPAPWQASPHG
jgi:endonuclease/exonuclease/phosphatase family metal-dependent hydrolase